MFEVGFWELALCIAIALVVLGPQKLPGIVRALGHWTGRARSYVRHLTAELEREAGQSGLKRELGDAARALRETKDAVDADLRRLTRPGPDDDRKP